METNTHIRQATGSDAMQINSLMRQTWNDEPKWRNWKYWRQQLSNPNSKQFGFIIQDINNKNMIGFVMCEWNKPKTCPKSTKHLHDCHINNFNINKYNWETGFNHKQMIIHKYNIHCNSNCYIQKHWNKLPTYYIAFTDIALYPIYRKNGLGTKLIKFVIHSFPSGTRFGLEVKIKNVSAIKCYQKCNFEITQKLTNYYGKSMHGYKMILISDYNEIPIMKYALTEQRKNDFNIYYNKNYYKWLITVAGYLQSVSINCVEFHQEIMNIIAHFANSIHDIKTNIKYASIVIIGGIKSGKTLLVNQLRRNRMKHINKYVPTQHYMIYDTIFNLTNHKLHCSFIDTPGNVKYIKDIIQGISCADIGIITIILNENTFEQSLQELREFQLPIVHSYGIEKIIVCFTNIDKEICSHKIYTKYQKRMVKVLIKVGFDAQKIAFIPIDCVYGNNIIKCALNDKLLWYKGWNIKFKKEKCNGRTVLEAIEAMILQLKYESKIKNINDKPFIMPIANVISHISADVNKYIICGKVEQGTIKLNDKIKLGLMDNGVFISMNEIQRNCEPINAAEYGDYINISLLSRKPISIGDVLYGKSKYLSIKPCRIITAIVVVICSNKLYGIRNGYCGILCIRSGRIECELTNINWKITKYGINKQKSNTQFIKDKEQAEVVLSLKQEFIACEFKVCQGLGRFVVLDKNKWNPVMIGRIISLS
eukprot:422016_1